MSENNVTPQKDNTLGLKIAVAVLAVAVILLGIKVFWPAKPTDAATAGGDAQQQVSTRQAETEEAKASDEQNTESSKDSGAQNTKGGKDSDEQNAEGGKDSDTQSTEGSKDSDTQKDGTYLLTYSAGNGWEEGGAQMCTMELSLSNRTKESVKDWTLVLTVEGLMSVSGWNGNYEAKGDTLTVTPADYNGEIFENGVIYLGCNIGTKSALKITKATLNGTDCLIESGYVDQNAQNTGNGNQNSNQGNNKEQSVDVTELLKRAEAAKQGDDWLHTDGRRILDKDGKEVWLTGVNWFGYNTGTNT